MNQQSVNLPFGSFILRQPSNVVCLEELVASSAWATTLPEQAPFIVRLGGDNSVVQTVQYRAAMFSRGIHLGHHLGPRGIVRASRDEIVIHLEEATEQHLKEVIWRYALKVALTVRALGSGASHLKACAVTLDDRGVLLVGRGGSGKTTLANELAREGFHIAANTHVLATTERCWGINTWARVRNNVSDSYLPPRRPENQGDFDLRALILVQYNNMGNFHSDVLSYLDVAAFLRAYVCALDCYDLKEDICDIHSDGPIPGANALEEIASLFDAVMRSVPIYTVSADITSEPAREQAVSLVASLTR